MNTELTRHNAFLYQLGNLHFSLESFPSEGIYDIYRTHAGAGSDTIATLRFMPTESLFVEICKAWLAGN